MSPIQPMGCLLLGPHFVRLAASAGFTYEYVKSSLEGHVPIPDHLKGVSSGGIVASGNSPWTEISSRKTMVRIRNLEGRGIRGSDFHGLNKSLEKWGLLETGGGVIAPFIPYERIKSPNLRFLAKAAIAGSNLASEVGFINELFTCRSVFDNSKLFKILQRHFKDIGIDNIYRSRVKVEVIAADINGDPNGNLRVRPSIVTNYRPEDVWNVEKLIHGVVSGASITGFFPTHINEYGHHDTDGIVYSAFPIGLARRNGCNVIVVAKFNYKGQGFIDHEYIKWMSALHRSMDIMSDNETDKVISGYLRTNNDIEKINRMKFSILSLRKILGQVDSDIKTAIEFEINNIEDEISRLSSYGRRLIHIVIVESAEIPIFNFKNFDKKSNEIGEEIGRRAFFSSREDINRAYDMASNSK